MIDAARRLTDALEATPYASRLGLRRGEILPDAATASVPFAPTLANAQGFVHGGVAASLSLWSAMTVAVASDRAHAVSARPLSLSVSYLATAHEEALHATARLASRGRDVVHVQVEIESERGRSVALALVVLRMRDVALPDGLRRELLPPYAPGVEPPLVSPFSQAMGVELRGEGPGTAAMSLSHDVNEGLGGAIDGGALVSLADTCAALACLPSRDERMRGSATLSLSALFGAPLLTRGLAVGRSVADDGGGMRSAVVEVGPYVDASPQHFRSPALTACVSYRFVAAA